MEEDGQRGSEGVDQAGMHFHAEVSAPHCEFATFAWRTSSDTTLLTPPTLPFSVLHDRIHANNFSNLTGVHGSDKWRGPGDRCCRSVFFFVFFLHQC